MKILILSQYYPPETGAPQNRLSDLAFRLKNKGFEVTVLTAMPNYPKMKVFPDYDGKFFIKESVNNIIIYRSWIYISQNRSIFFRLLNYFSFVFSSMIAGLFIKDKFDYILCESPPLFLGISALFLKSIKKSKLIFNVSDLWPESAEKLGLIKSPFLLNISKYLEESCYKNSNFISAQTQGIVNDISNRFPYKKIFWLKNGVDIDYFNQYKFNNNWRFNNKFNSEDFILVYGGIIGYAQALEVIIKTADILKEHSQIKFLLVGDGPVKNSLLDMKNKLNLQNVHFIPNVDKTTMLSILHDADATIVPLKKLDIFKGAIPSKIFESLILKKPILLGVDGEAKKLFIDSGNCGLFFEPENHYQLADNIKMLYNNIELRKQLSDNAYDYVTKNFSREKISEDFINFILSN